jgi:hypothetical protein
MTTQVKKAAPSNGGRTVNYKAAGATNNLSMARCMISTNAVFADVTPAP